jgi:hypothetical protein
MEKVFFFWISRFDMRLFGCLLGHGHNGMYDSRLQSLAISQSGGEYQFPLFTITHTPKLHPIDEFVPTCKRFTGIADAYAISLLFEGFCSTPLLLSVYHQPHNHKIQKGIKHGFPEVGSLCFVLDSKLWLTFRLVAESEQIQN